jgi:uncharacterized membrane protein YheB (UPF0754 family)
MMLASLSAAALPNTNSKVEKKQATEAAAETNTALAMKQLQEENNQLKQQLVRLMNENEDLRDQLTYQVLMTNLQRKLNEQKQQEQLAEMTAHLGYNNMMANMLLMIKNKAR